jgi:predicted GNAT family acetyltransferase
MYHILNNIDLSRFEISLTNGHAYIDYRWFYGRIAFMHTFVPPEYRGKGVSTELVIFALEFARTEELEILVFCPFIEFFIKKNPGYESLKSIVPIQ